jgi:hypothetical protein
MLYVPAFVCMVMSAGMCLSACVDVSCLLFVLCM